MTNLVRAPRLRRLCHHSQISSLSRQYYSCLNRSKAAKPVSHEAYLTIHHRSISNSSSLHHYHNATNKAAATDATVEETDIKTKLEANVVKPKSLFPWRHSPHPLPRLSPPDESGGIEYYDTEYYTKRGHLGPGWPQPMPSWFRMACQANSMRLLGLTYGSMLLPWSRMAWIHEMEDAFCDAFGKGVNGVILDTYSMDGASICCFCYDISVYLYSSFNN